MIAQHLPILQIVLPLMAAPVCMVIRHPQVVWIWATLITFLCLPISIALLVQVMAEGVIVYELGGWAAPWGIEYRIDKLNAFVLVIVTAIGAVVMPYARRTVAYTAAIAVARSSRAPSSQQPNPARAAACITTNVSGREVA